MTVGEIFDLLAEVPRDRAVLVRCEWEGVDPAGVVFRIDGLTLEMACDTAVPFVAIECDQDFDAHPEEPEL